MEDSILTSARHKVWDAINSYAPIDGNFFKKKYTLEEDSGKVTLPPNPSPNDLPALLIEPSGANSPWVLNQAQLVTYPLTITWWTNGWDIRKGEWLWQQILDALYKNLEPMSEGAHRVIDKTPLVWTPEENPSVGGTRSKWSISVNIMAGYRNPTNQ